MIERSNDFSKRHNLKTLEKEDLRDRTPSLTAQLPHHHPLLRKGNVQSKYLVFCEKSLTLNVFILTRVRPLLCVPRVIKINNSDQVRSNLSLKLGHLTQENLTEWRQEISSYPMGMKMVILRENSIYCCKKITTTCIREFIEFLPYPCLLFVNYFEVVNMFLYRSDLSGRQQVGSFQRAL